MAAPASRYEQMERATSGLDAPFAVVDLDAFRLDATDLTRRAAGKPLRVRLRELYPWFDELVAVRDEVDPGWTVGNAYLGNAYLQRVLGS